MLSLAKTGTLCATAVRFSDGHVPQPLALLSAMVFASRRLTMYTPAVGTYLETTGNPGAKWEKRDKYGVPRTPVAKRSQGEGSCESG